MTPADFQASRRWIPTSFGETAYVERGEGPAALFVHGFPLNGFHWRDALEAMGDRRRCIAPDLMGLGHTRAGPDQDLSFASQARMLLKFLDALGVETVDLVGNDSGGAVCQVIAATAPQRVRSLVLTNCDTADNTSPPALASTVALARQGQLGEALARVLSRPELARSPAGLGSTFEFPERLTPELLEVYLGPLAASPERLRQVDRYVLAISASHLTEYEPALRRLTAPTLIVWGEADVFFEVKWAHWLADVIPGVRRLEVLNGAKLFFPEERPETLIPLIREHWQAAEASVSRAPVDAG